MAELWNNFLNWYKNANIEIYLNWILTIGIPTIIGILAKLRNNSLAKEIKAIASSNALSKETSEMFDDLKEKYNGLVEDSAKLREMLSKENALLMIMLSNSKIPAEAKEYANKVFNSKELVVEKVERVEDIVNKAIEYSQELIEESVEQEQGQEENPVNELLNEIKSV